MSLYLKARFGGPVPDTGVKFYMRSASERYIHTNFIVMFITISAVQFVIFQLTFVIVKFSLENFDEA